ncbi:hypothetical protein B0H19DRAFT_1069412 [Mycena capillaripes]|nr:hypothetical protein B0H19DRAFT_1069412 [Mycena capillaripes]
MVFLVVYLPKYILEVVLRQWQYRWASPVKGSGRGGTEAVKEERVCCDRVREAASPRIAGGVRVDTSENMRQWAAEKWAQARKRRCRHKTKRRAAAVRGRLLGQELRGGCGADTDRGEWDRWAAAGSGSGSGSVGAAKKCAASAHRQRRAHKSGKRCGGGSIRDRWGYWAAAGSGSGRGSAGAGAGPKSAPRARAGSGEPIKRSRGAEVVATEFGGVPGPLLEAGADREVRERAEPKSALRAHGGSDEPRNPVGVGAGGETQAVLSPEIEEESGSGRGSAGAGVEPKGALRAGVRSWRPENRSGGLGDNTQRARWGRWAAATSGSAGASEAGARGPSRGAASAGILKREKESVRDGAYFSHMWQESQRP